MMRMEIKGAAGSDVPRMSVQRAEQLVRYVLAARFPGDAERQVIVPRGQRLNFCCPYCGDSKDAHKKRGNLYVDRLAFKCYNGGCEKYSDFEWFLRNFEQEGRLTQDELTALKIQIQEKRAEHGDDSKFVEYGANLQMMVEAQWDKLLVRRSDLMSKLKLWDIRDTSPQGVYLKKRMQVVDGKFAWDNFKKRMFVFNLDKTGEFVFGLQTKQMDEPGAKYKTYTIEKVHEWFAKSSPGLIEYASRYNRLSTLFGVLRINLNNTITVFEGPMDHFLYPNSLATCGIGNDVPLLMENMRYFQDNDEAGVLSALDHLAKGESVFLWKKMFQENPHLYGNKRKDYNDIFINGTLANKPPGTLDQYFSDHKHDGIYL